MQKKDSGNMTKVLAINNYIPNTLHTGGRIYSYYLFRAIADLVDVSLLGQEDVEKDVRNQVSAADWANEIMEVEYKKRKVWHSLFSVYPNSIFQCRTICFKKKLREIALEDSYDAIICSHFITSWAALYINSYRERHKKKSLPIILITHNYESAIRWGLFRNEKSFIRASVYLLDAFKTFLYERKILSKYDIVTAITNHDSKLIEKYTQDRPVVITPGYQGKMLQDRSITNNTKRQVVLVGSYYWVAKQNNVKKLVELSDTLFSRNDINLVVVGAGPDSFYRSLSKYSSVITVGRVNSFEEYIAESRGAIIAETDGGGFKLKALDYIYNRIPIFALQDSIMGLPINPGKDYLEYKNLHQLINGIVYSIDDFSLLNQLANNAFNVCEGKFDWCDRGYILSNVITKLVAR